MEVCEPLLAMYDLYDWMNPKYATLTNAEIRQKCTPMAGQYARMRYRGIVRSKLGMQAKLAPAQTTTTDTQATQEDD